MKTIEYSVKGNIGFMVLNRPEKHNALSFDLLDDIDEAFDTAEADEDRLFLFSGPVCGFLVLFSTGSGPCNIKG